MGRTVTAYSPSMNRIVAALEKHGPMERDEIAEYAHVAISTLKSGGYMQILMAVGRVHIGAWKRNYPGEATPIYSAGEGVNKKRPQRFSGPEKSRRWRKRTGYRSAEYMAAQRTTAAMAAMAADYG